MQGTRDRDRYWLGKILWPDGIRVWSTPIKHHGQLIQNLADTCLDILDLPVSTWEDPGTVSGEIDGKEN